MLPLPDTICIFIVAFDVFTQKGTNTCGHSQDQAGLRGERNGVRSPGAPQLTTHTYSVQTVTPTGDGIFLSHSFPGAKMIPTECEEDINGQNKLGIVIHSFP